MQIAVIEYARHMAGMENANSREFDEASPCRVIDFMPGHPFYVGVQFHPEFKSRPNRPHPLFLGFVSAALDRSRDAE